MKVVSIACNNCGAPLEVPVKTKYLTCSFCESRLEVQHSGNAYFTSVLEAVKDLKGDIHRLKLEAAIDRLDRAWEREREGLMIRNKHGDTSVPSSAHVFVGWAITGICAVVAVVGVVGGSVIAFGALFAGLIAWVHTMNMKGKLHRYESRRRAFWRKRRELVAELKE